MIYKLPSIKKSNKKQKEIMKKQMIIILLVMGLTAPAVFAQKCNYYLPLVEESGLEYENYNRRDRLEGSQKIIINKVQTIDDKIIATVNASYFDRRNRMEHEAEYDIICKDNALRLDFRSLIDHGILEGFQGMNIHIESDDIILPSDLSVGQDLPDTSVNITVSTGGLQIAELNILIENRKVIGKENITVPAGTFDTFKISYQTHIETRAVGIPIRSNSRTIDYYAENIGLVRAEFYDDKNRPQGYSLLGRIF